LNLIKSKAFLTQNQLTFAGGGGTTGAATNLPDLVFLSILTMGNFRKTIRFSKAGLRLVEYVRLVIISKFSEKNINHIKEKHFFAILKIHSFNLG
jgi:hypothetical protein